MPSLRNLSRSRRRSSTAVTASEALPSVLRPRPRSGSAELLQLGEARTAFDPNSRGIQRWHQLRLLMILYEALAVPFLCVFTPQAARGSLTGVYLCEVLFVVDVYVQLNMGFYEDGDMLRDSRKSRLKYLRSPAFALDLLALVPLSLLVGRPGSTPLAALDLTKLLRVWRLPELISDLDNLYARHFALLKLAKVLGLTLALSHLVACGRFLFGTDAVHADPWVQQLRGEQARLGRSTTTEYLAAVFWAFGLLTGLFEGELPQSSTAFAFTILVAFCGFSLFTYLCATFFLLSKCESGASETAEARVNQLKHLLAFHRVPDALQERAVEYLKRYHTQAEANDRQAAKLLCPSIVSDIQIELLRDAVARIPVFAGCDLRFVKAVTSLLELVSFPAHHTLFRAGDRGDAMYVVHSGVLHTVVDGVKVRELRKGSYFGEVAVFARLPRSAAMVTTTYCTLYRLSQFHVDKLLDGYPRCARQIAATVQTIIGARSDNAQGGGAGQGANVNDERSGSDPASGLARGKARLALSFPQLVRLKQAVKALSMAKAAAKKTGATVEPPALPTATATTTAPNVVTKGSDGRSDLTPPVSAAPRPPTGTDPNGPRLPSATREPSTDARPVLADADRGNAAWTHTSAATVATKTAPSATAPSSGEPVSPPRRRLESRQSSRFDTQLQRIVRESSTSTSSKALRAFASDSREAEARRPSLVAKLQARRLSLKVHPSTPQAPLPKYQSQQQLVANSKEPEAEAVDVERRETFMLQGYNALQLVRTSFFGGRGRVAPSSRPDAIRGFYDNAQGSGMLSPPHPRWWSRLLLKQCVDVNTQPRIAWVVAMQLVCCYDWVLVPLELSFRLSDTPAAWAIDALNAAADALLWTDMYLSLNTSFFFNAEKISDTTRSAERYLHSWPFALDLVTSWPYWVFAPDRFIASSGGLLRLPRLLRVWRTRGYITEADEFLHFNSKQRLLLFGLLLVMLYHIVACLFFGITYAEGFSLAESAWIPSHDVELHRVNASHYADYAGNLLAVDSAEFVTLRATQYFRALYYAANVLAALGRTIEPASDVQYAAALAFMLSGFVITAVVVDEVMKRFTASAFEQKEFFEVRTRIQLFLKRQDAPLAIHQRVNSFLDFWWSAHRGAIVDEILQELPESIKRDIVRSMCAPAMETLGLMFELTNEAEVQVDTETQPNQRQPSRQAKDVIEMIGGGEDTSEPGDASPPSQRRQIETIVLDNAKFVLYGQHEVIYRPGDYAGGLFFLLEGSVSMLVEGEGPRRVPIGGFFGSAALQRLGVDSGVLSEDCSDPTRDAASISYTELVTAVSGCIVVFLSREHLYGMTRSLPPLPAMLCQLERQLRHVTVSRTTELKLIRPGMLRVASTHPPPLRRMHRETSLLHSLAQLSHKYASWNNAITFNPDAAAVRGWDTLVFVLSAVQCARVMVNVCLGVSSSTDGGLHSADSETLALELVFLVDLYVQSRLGFYEFGNKIMDRDAIRRHYFLSAVFAVDVLALLPLFAINAVLPGGRLEVLNLNKMLRALKFPRQLHSLSTRFVKFMVQIRLLKLAFYTFFATHILGCIWFDFAANHSGFHSVISGATTVAVESHSVIGSFAAGGGAHSPAPTGGHKSFTDALSFGDNEWLPPAHLEHAPRLLQYLSSLFWSFGLMSASSTGELPKTVAQAIFSVATMTTGFFLLAYVIGNFSDIIELQESDNKHFVAQVSSLRKLLHHFRLPARVEDKFKKYFLFKRFHSITQEHVLERVLPPSLVVDIRLFQLQPMIVKVAFLVGMEEAVTRMLVSLFTQVLFVKDEFVCRYGEEGREMFFIFTGVLDIYIPVHKDGGLAGSSQAEDNTLRKVNAITAGSYFGEAALFTNAPRNAFVKASTSCILYQLSRQSLELVFERFPLWKQKVLRIVKIQQQQQQLTRLAQEAQATPSAPSGGVGKLRGLKRTLPRMDMINSRAEGIEELLLSTRRTSTVHAPSWAVVAQQRARVATAGKKLVAPLRSRLRSLQALLVRGTDIQSRYYRGWLRLVTACAMFMAVLLPYRIAYDSLDRNSFTPALVRVLEGISELVFWLDLWFHFHVRESHEAMELYEQDHLQGYKRERLLVDVAAAFPLDHLLSSFAAAAVGSDLASVRRWLRLNRCLKMVNFVYYRNEVTRRSVAYEANRVATLWLQYLLVIFWASCAYFAVSMHEGFGLVWQSWRPPYLLDLSDDPEPELLLLRLLRGFFYATTAFVKKGRTFTPTAELDTAFSIVVSFVGQIVMAIMISEIANVFLLYIDNEVQFRKNHITVEHFLARAKVSGPLKLRAHAFLTSWWSSHAGIDYQVIFNELPQSVRTEGIAHIVAKPLAKFTDRLLRPLLPRYVNAAAVKADAVDGSIPRLSLAIARKLRFVGYPRDESVIVEGSVGRAMYFVVKGYLVSKSVSNPTLYQGGRFRSGDFFGNTGLLGHSISLFTVTAVRACDLFVLDAQQLEEVVRGHPFFALALQVAAVVVRRKKAVDELFWDEDGARVASAQATRVESVISDGGQHTNSVAGDASDRQPADLQSEEPLSSEEQTAVDRLKALVGTQSSELTWRAAFRQFTELILARGSMDTDELPRDSVESKADGVSQAAGGPTSAGVRHIVRLM